ncbi:hypothetical protein HBI56_077760 [Parastagonospora nodorum]|nr:hypothetical protein HBH46_069940 [Parastagonospora nodorum]KAH4306227.1 hypothetical protein HBI01_059670 [Parastagonospora nodorum]KAH4310992.1 hypothetical protein HBI02_097390 [Parastagonospora nodorum]KAH4332996.1 hypothetical protein HBI00_049000 [Parastagonospora nodorum]KAH4377706.1 hypothetical protein HBH94_085270 [Parastagonospora nodorum]
MLTNLVALTAGLASTASAFTCTGNYFSFFNRGGDAMTYQRLDPILQPGTQGTHMHSFDGGNVLSASMGFADTQAATCTTARIKTDKSLYWRPTLYWNGNGTGFHRVPEQSTKIYYKYGDGDKWANVTEFPGQFNMIAGVPEKRADGDNPAGVRWGCHNPDGRSDKIFANGFPTGFQSCDYGFASEVTFPSCWNGKPLDPENPNAHMAYPTNGGGVGVENCPTTHRAARFPTVFIEFWYDISSFNKQYAATDNPWVLSNGDPTGYSFHADFLNGWEKGVLAKATAETGGCNCGCGCGQEEMEQCFGSENVNKNEDTAWAKCGLENAGGESAAVVEKLPGCNPIQAGPGPATKASGAGCDANDLPASGGAKSSAASYAVASMASATSSATVAPSASSSKAVNNDSNTKVSLSISLGNKGLSEAPAATPVASPEQQYGNAPSVPSAPAKPDTPAGSELPSLSLATTPAASKPTGGANGDCKAPVYVTLTPTVYVTAGSNATSCGMGTVTKTMTETATVTVAGASGIQYGSY